jgi:hypothetical protein
MRSSVPQAFQTIELAANKYAGPFDFAFDVALALRIASSPSNHSQANLAFSV